MKNMAGKKKSETKIEVLLLRKNKQTNNVLELGFYFVNNHNLLRAQPYL